MPLNFQSEPKTSHSGVLAIALLVASVLLFGAYCAEGADGPIHAVQNATRSLSAPVQTAGSTIGYGLNNAATAISDGSADEGTLSALKKQNEQLRQQVAQLEEYRLEAERLEALLGIKNTFGIDGISAAVIGKSGEAYSQTITISAGSAEGVDVGQPVMGYSGVLGQVVSVSDHSATVRLLSDPQSGAAALVQSTRFEGIVRGSLDGFLYLEDLDSGAVVNEGDVILTSGQGGSYISGLMIGTVVRVENLGDIGSQRIIVAPNDTVNQLQDVIVVTSVSASAAAPASGGEQ